MPVSTYGSGNTLTSTADRNVAKNSDFMKAFGNGTTNTRTIQPQQTEKVTTQPARLGYTPNDQSFFDFDRVSSGNSPYPSQNPFGTPGGGLPGWGSDSNFRPLSPPDSASPFSKEWNFGFQNMPNPSASNMFTNNETNSNTKAQYGQVTPPDEEHDGASTLDEQFQEQQEESNSTAPTRKRKRANGYNAKSNQTPSKRSRKNNSRRSGAATNNTDSSKPEDTRRTKFLERNRVAASKCRHKKKEWTQNLEDRSRELQKTNQNMRVLIDSLRQEALWLKGEMLRHGECDSTNIKDYLKASAHEMSSVPKRESSSPFDELSRSHTTIDLDGQSDHEDEIPQQRRPTNAEIAQDESALESLLASSINRDAEEKNAVKTAG